MSYIEDWLLAVQRSHRYGLIVPPSVVEPSKRYAAPTVLEEFPYVMHESVGTLNLLEVVGQCLSLHYRLAPAISKWLKCHATFTIGWIDDGSSEGLFKFDESFIEERLANGSESSTVGIHAWLTLPSMEVIDVTLSTSLAVRLNRPEGMGGVIFGYADALSNMAYRPMLVGSDFLKRTGLLIEV